MASTRSNWKRIGRPSGLAGDFTGLDRDQRALVGLHREHQLEKPWTRIAFDVVFDAAAERLQLVGDLMNVVDRDVTLIGTRVDGDAGCTRVDARPHGFDDRRNASATRIANRRDLVDVYGKFRQGALSPPRRSRSPSP